jgi:hypothetical protein
MYSLTASRRYFRKHCQELLEANQLRRSHTIAVPSKNEMGLGDASQNTTATAVNKNLDVQGFGSAGDRVCDSPEACATSIAPGVHGLVRLGTRQATALEAERFRKREGLRARTRGQSLAVEPALSSPVSPHTSFREFPDYMVRSAKRVQPRPCLFLLCLSQLKRCIKATAVFRRHSPSSRHWHLRRLQRFVRVSLNQFDNTFSSPTQNRKSVTRWGTHQT